MYPRDAATTGQTVRACAYIPLHIALSFSLSFTKLYPRPLSPRGLDAVGTELRLMEVCGVPLPDVFLVYTYKLRLMRLLGGSCGLDPFYAFRSSLLVALFCIAASLVGLLPGLGPTHSLSVSSLGFTLLCSVCFACVASSCSPGELVSKLWAVVA